MSKLRVRMRRNSGFALFTVVWFVAIVTVLGLTMVATYLANTRATQIEVERIRVDMLLDSGFDFAALSLVAPRANVSNTAIPSASLLYAMDTQQVRIEITNEAAYIDVRRANRELLMSALNAVKLPHGDKQALISQFASFAEPGAKVSFRKLAELLSKFGAATELLQHLSVHNGQPGVHPGLASESVLSLLPDLPKAQRDLLLRDRHQEFTSLFSSPVESAFFTRTISSHYRIRCSIEMNGRRYSRTQIIKMLNRKGQLYEVVARIN